jgi:hypothetical protein
VRRPSSNCGREHGHTFNCHRPRRRTIPVCRDGGDEPNSRGVLDPTLSRRMTALDGAAQMRSLQAKRSRDVERVRALETLSYGYSPSPASSSRDTASSRGQVRHISPTGKSLLFCGNRVKPENKKYSVLQKDKSVAYFAASRPTQRGVGHRHDEGRVAVDADVAMDDRGGSVRQRRVVLTSRCWRLCTWGHSTSQVATEAKSRSPGRARYKP